MTSGRAALIVSVIALLFALTGMAGAATKGSTRVAVQLKQGKIPAALIPTVAKARNASRLSGKTLKDLTLVCPENTVDLGTWCLESSAYPIDPADVGKNDFFWASQKCIEIGGYLPSAAQLIGAANRVKLASIITDNETTASVDEDYNDGRKDKREMSSTLVTTAAGSNAAGSQGVTEGSRGDPRAGEPDPTPQPANPSPDTLQYVTVYDNANAGGFAGSQPVSQAQAFRCAFDKQQGASVGEVG